MVKISVHRPDGTFHSMFMDGYLKELLDGFKNAVLKHNTSVVTVIDGRSGMGKSTLANQIGIYCDPNFTLDKIFYTPDDFLNGLASAKKGDFLSFDEAMLISSRSALSSINRMIVQAMSMIRSKNLFVCFCVNSLFDLDRNLAISRADCLLHVYGQTLIDRGRFGAFFRARDGADRLKQLYLYGKKMYDYNRPKANFITTFTKEFIVNEVEYDRRKQIGVNNFLRGSEPAQTKGGRHRDLLIRYIIDNKILKIDEIVDIANISRATVFRVMAKDD